jgi:hypothetical protein
VRVDNGFAIVDVGLNHQAHRTPGAPDVVAVVELARVSNGTDGLADNRSDNAGGKRNNQDLVTGQLRIFFDGSNAGELQQLLQDGVGLVVVAEVAFQVGDDLPETYQVCCAYCRLVSFITSRRAMAALRICSPLRLRW